MNQQQQPRQTWGQQLQATASWIALVSGVLAVSVEVFLHRSRSFGERYIGLQGAAVLLVPFWAIFWPQDDPTPLLYFVGGYLVMCFFIRVSIQARIRSGGPQEHTRYTGYPRILRLMPRLSEQTAKLIVEPMLVFLAGVFTLPSSRPLGSYLMLASLGLLISMHLSVGYDRARTLDMHDAAIDQRQLAERFRDVRGDRF